MTLFRPARPPVRRLSCDLVNRLAASIAEVAQIQFASGRGATIFLAGGPGAGHGLVIDQLERLFAQRSEDVRLLRGELTQSGDYRVITTPRSDCLPGAISTVAELGALLASLAAPASALIGQIVSSMANAQRFIATISRDQASTLGEPRLLQRAIRALAYEQPLCLAISSAEPLGAVWWLNLIESVSAEADVDLPLLLILAMEAPSQLPKDGSEPRPLWRLARSLVKSDRAQWRAMPSLDFAAVGALIGASTSALSQEILAITAGQAGWVVDIFEQWQERGVVIQGRRGLWAFDHAELSKGLAPTNEIVHSRLRWALRRDLQSFENGRKLLALGALQGETFHLEPIAELLAMPLAACEQLADRLTRDAGNESLLKRAPEFLVDRPDRDARQTALYRFTSRLIWSSVAQYGFSDLDRARFATECAACLKRAYAANPAAVAGALASLYKFAVDLDESSRWSATAAATAGTDLLHWQVRSALDEQTQWDSWSEDRARRAAGFLLDASVHLSATRPWDELYPLLKAVERLAATHALKREQSAATRLQGMIYAVAGDYELARRKLQVAADIACAAGATDEQCQLLCELAYLDRAEGNPTKAEARLNEAIEACKASGDARTEAATLGDRGELALEYGYLPRAQEDFTAALNIARQVGHSASICTILTKMSVAQVVQHDISGAVSSLREALALAQATGNKACERAASESLGVLLQDPESSYAEHNRALALARELNDAPAQADSLLSLARCALALRRWEEAKRFLQEGFALWTRLNDRVGAAWCLREIGMLQMCIGAFPQARENFHAALEAFEAEHVQAGQVATQRALASLAARSGDLGTAKRQRTGLKSSRADGERSVQVLVNHQTRPREGWHPGS